MNELHKQLEALVHFHVEGLGHKLRWDINRRNHKLITLNQSYNKIIMKRSNNDNKQFECAHHADIMKI